MSNKTLKTSVRLDAKSAVKSLDTLERKIQSIQKTIDKTNNNANKINNSLTPVVRKLNNATKNTDQLANSANKVNKNFQKTSSVLSGVTSKLKAMAATYLGVMGARAMFNTADVITSAQNKLNYVSAQSLGNNGYTDDGKYTQATLKQTQAAMDKMYQTSQKVRMGYTNMMANVSKSMMLAGEAFQNNTDNAIRFQEIMSKAYTIGGASAAEQASSMYQLIQALGSGILQGDELRSVREGASLAYKEIEKFAQGIYKCDDSLKDMASEGLITSEIVVAAILNAGNRIDAIFNNTKMTFAQAMTVIKNTAIKAFEPVLQKMTEILNSDAGQAILGGIQIGIILVADALGYLMDIFSVFINWFADNWYWIQYIVYAVVSAIIIHLGVMAAQAIIAGIQMFIAFITGLSPLYLWIVMIGVVVAAVIWLANTIATASEFICQILLIVAGVIALIGAVTGSTTLLIISLVITFIAVILYLFMEFGATIMGWIFKIAAYVVNILSFLGNVIASFLAICGSLFINLLAFVVNAIFGAVNVIVTLIGNLFKFIGNVAAGCFNWLVATGYNVCMAIANATIGLWNTIVAVAQNIGIAFENAWNAAKSAFWGFIADCLQGIKFLEPAINAIAKVFGIKGFTLSGLIDSVADKASGAKQKGYVDVGNAFKSGANTYSYKNSGDAWSNGYNTFNYDSLKSAWSEGWNTLAFDNTFNTAKEAFGTFGKVDADAWYNKGYDMGSQAQDWLNNKASSIKDAIANFSLSDLGALFDKLTGSNAFEKLSSNIDKIATLPNNINELANAPNNGGSGGSYDPSKVLDNIKKNLGDTSDNVGDIKDTLDLTEEDLKYLRQIAEMEWKKEFTTASITVDMSNYNTINGDSDLDGIVTKLTDKLYEELNSVANGVYA